MYNSKQSIILASGSPRRKEFLENLGLSFDVVVASINEAAMEHELPGDFVLRMAREKASCVAGQFPESCVISGDTIVCLGQTILGKPLSTDHAVDLLLQLSGREHIVRSGFCVMQKSRQVVRVRSVETRVTFTEFSKDAARAYVATGEPMDKAGAYGIQGVGGMFVRSIEGSYTNVVGLPVAELLEILVEEKIIEISVE
ncbi:Maf family protein [Desulforhopalus sp. 52FAK]